MTSAIAVPTNSSIPPFVSSVREIPLIRISESQTNPRRLFDEIKLAELADNIRQHGVLQPVLVRPLTGGEPDTFELVAGARRYRASKLAGRETIPASVRELTDTECLELQLIENLQRAAPRTEFDAESAAQDERASSLAIAPFLNVRLRLIGT